MATSVSSSPYFCRWGNGRVLTYTRHGWLTIQNQMSISLTPGATVKDYLRREVEILRTKNHWRKAYFYLWDEPLNIEQYNAIRSMASEIHAYAPDVSILTTYYCGPSDAPLASNNFEAFLKVPEFLRPHTQIYCTRTKSLQCRNYKAIRCYKFFHRVVDIRMLGTRWRPRLRWHLGMRGTQHRAVMWRVWKEGGTGVLIAQQPVASLRLERLLSGLQDIEYLKLYASRFGRDEGLNLLEKTGMYLGPERYTWNTPIDVMRGEVYRTCRS
ncbi:hypothetical protein HAX54_007970 [Datura stramonium]|uniref:Uncharacterized protein n=1 Tax=Datura stramonium TaxID=4076 RepID=A0ABS8TD87_DATST|nr:hypothetical protein [Datura stramonium]